MFCKRVGHAVAKCRKLAENTVQDRVKVVQAEKLYFGCLKTGHHSRSCDNRSTCEKCQKRHPTCLHNDQLRECLSSTTLKRDLSKEISPKREIAATATTNRVMQEGPNKQISLIVPVWVSTTEQPDKEVLVYTLLDTQSDTTFILDEVAQDLDTRPQWL